jgi:hypothetical protein
MNNLKPMLTGITLALLASVATVPAHAENAVIFGIKRFLKSPDANAPEPGGQQYDPDGRPHGNAPKETWRPEKEKHHGGKQH